MTPALAQGRNRRTLISAGYPQVAANRQSSRDRHALMWPPKKELFGMMYSPTDYEEAVDAITTAAESGQGGLVSCHAAHAAVTFSSSDELREVINSFHMVTPDGQPVKWALNWGHRLHLEDRVYGPELMLRLCRRAAEDGLPIFLYGGSDEQLMQRLKDNLQQACPGLIVAGSYVPPFRPLTAEEDEQLIELINASSAKIVFVGLGCPKQDLFAYEHRDSLNAVLICVGAAFDFHAGAKAVAPAWMQRRGLEWLFRLSQEPGRLWKRYLITNTSFVLKLIPFLLRRRLGLGSKGGVKAHD